MTSGQRLISTWPAHPHGHQCPSCGENILREAEVNLVCALEPCDCDRESYEHLVERIWHRACMGMSVEESTRQTLEATGAGNGW